MKYKVIDPKGVVVDGEVKPQGSILEGAKESGQFSAWLHFKQIELAKEDSKPTPQPKEEQPKVELRRPTKKAAKKKAK